MVPLVLIPQHWMRTHRGTHATDATTSQSCNSGAPTATNSRGYKSTRSILRESATRVRILIEVDKIKANSINHVTNL